eukprot:gene8257-845_t
MRDGLERASLRRGKTARSEVQTERLFLLIENLQFQLPGRALQLDPIFGSRKVKHIPTLQVKKCTPQHPHANSVAHFTVQTANHFKLDPLLMECHFFS